MIVELDLDDDATAREVHRIALRSYAVEAELIGSWAIPPLHETLDEMRAQPLRWLGAYEDDELAGFVAWTQEDDVRDIDRLCVDPDHFRKGLATRLVTAVTGEGPVTVATGAANGPAVALYERLGFRRTGTFEPEPGLLIAEFRRDN